MGFADNFNDNSIDTARWVKSTIETQNLSVTVLEQNSRVEVQPVTSTGGSNYNALRTVANFNLTGGEVVVKVTSACTGSNCDTQFIASIDANNYLAVVVEAGTIYWKSRVAGVNANQNAAYSGATHLWWRIKHRASDDHVLWDTSTDGTSWTNRRDIARPIAVTALRVELCAGSFSSDSAPGVAWFDDFTLRNGSLPPFFLSGDD